MRHDVMPIRTFVYAVARTPFGKYQGSLSGYSAAELGALAIDEVVARARLPEQLIAGVFVGTGMLGAAALTAARQSVLRSKLPQTTPSVGIDRACCSGMSAIAFAAAEVRAGERGAFVCGGLELLSATPRLLGRTLPATGDVVVEDPLLLRTPFAGGSIASYTSEEALRLGVDREIQDAWAVQSHERYFDAHNDGFFEFERFEVPVRRAAGKPHPSVLGSDEGPRSDTSAERLAMLATVRGSATITAGNAPGLNDGAAFAIVGGASLQHDGGLIPLAEIVSTVRVAEGPTSGTRTPALAIQKLLRAHDLRPEQLDVIEINEAFAATPLVSTLVLAEFDAARAERLRRLTNPNGGAVAIGHPMGASGARIVMTLIAELSRRGGGLGAAAICGGFGQGEAIMIRVDESATSRAARK